MTRHLARPLAPRALALALLVALQAGPAAARAPAQEGPPAASAPAVAPATPDPAALEFLLASSARDFRGSGAARPTAVRGVRLGYLVDAGRGVYLLCGAFRARDPQGGWTPFATLRTGDYEQWLGGAASAYCAHRGIRWYPGDQSAALMRRLAD